MTDSLVAGVGAQASSGWPRERSGRAVEVVTGEGGGGFGWRYVFGIRRRGRRRGAVRERVWRRAGREGR